MDIKTLNSLLERLGIDNYTILGDLLVLYNVKDVLKLQGEDLGDFRIVYVERKEKERTDKYEKN